MYRMVLHIPGSAPQSVNLPDGIFSVGADPSNQFRLNTVGVSHRHCQFRVQNGELKIMDLGSSNGTFCNGREVSTTAEMTVPPNSALSIGEVRIDALGSDQAPAAQAPAPSTPPLQPRPAAPSTPPPQVQPRPIIPSTPPPPPSSSEEQQTPRGNENMAEEEARINQSVQEARSRAQGDEVPVLAVSGIPAEARPIVQKIKKLAHVELLKRLNLKRMAMNGEDTHLDHKAKDVIHEILSELSVPLPAGVTREKIEKELYYEAIGLGPLENLIAMSAITEIMVNGPDRIYVEHKGVLYRTDMAFADSNQVMAAIERIVSPLGRRIDESSPMVDARLKDGSRVNAIIPPLSLVGPSITIRKFSKKPLQVSNLIAYGSISQEIADFLNLCVKLRKNIVISGGTGSGKTTLLNILSGFLPNRERIVTIEDAAELQLRQEHVVRLESRPANIEGKGEIAIRDLVKNSLRMRPDRIVIGECRGGEALDMLQAMNTGHDGSLTTIHANTPRDCLSRLETLVLMAGFDLPLRAIREQIASAISIVVQINREKDGSRKITCVSEITKMEGDIITMQDLFVYRQDGWTPDGKMTGRHIATGCMPTFIDEIKRSGLPYDLSIFTPPQEPRRQGGGLFR